ncbi:MAG: TonB-dependent receptor [Muribaculaceae bacterium]
MNIFKNKKSFVTFLTERNNYFRKFATLLLFLLCFQVSYAQKAHITLNLNQVTVKKALLAIESKCDYTFLYNDAEIDVNRKVTINAKNEELRSVLRKILPNATWTVNNKRIIITPAPKGTDSQVDGANAGESGKAIRGRVVDTNGEPLVGVSVVVVGNKTGVITDADGRYRIAAEKGQQIQFSYVGYTPQRVKVGDKTTIDVTLKEDPKALDEVVVVGYGVQKKVNLSGAVSALDPKVIEDRPVLTTGQALQGAIANLNVTIGSGEADDSPSYNIRGTTSLNGGSPLIIIDGVVSTSDVLNRMNPTDIATISVLKDAASAAIYGSRAAFGVILVTTKQGKSEKLTVTYGNNFVLTTNTRMPDVITDPYIVATTRNTMSYPWYNLYNEEQLAYAKKVSEDPSISPFYVNPDGSYSYFGRTDWVDEAYKEVGFSMIHNVGISGKTDKVSYYFSGSYNRKNGMLNYGNDHYNRYNLRSKIDFKLTDWWTFGTNLSYTNSDYNYANAMTSSYRAIYRKNPMDVVKNPDGTWTDSSVANIGSIAEGGRATDWRTDMAAQLSTRIDVLKDVLFLQGNFSYSTIKKKSNWYYVPVYYRNGPELPLLEWNTPSSANSSSSDTKHISVDLYGTFQKKFFDKHFVLATAGFNQEDYRYDYIKATRKELISNSLPTINLATGDMSVSQSITSYAIRGAFFRLNYIFDDKYIFEFNGRYDGTSRFPKNDRFVFNPSGSVAWVASSEKFFEPLRNVVSFLKFRASYGSLGNQDVSNYAYIATMPSGKISQILDKVQPMYVGAPGLVSGSLTWEKVTTTNFGLDVNFLDNRLTVSADAYVRRTKDMLTKGATLPSVLGTSVPQENAADLKTKGWELTIGWKDRFNLAGKPFDYSVNFNLADSRAWITKYENPTGYLGDYYVGREIGEIWGCETLGFFTSQEDIDNHADQSWSTSYPGTRPLAPGDLKFRDLNGDGKIDDGTWTLDDHGDYRKIGNSRARYTFGINLGASWNGIDFSLFAQGVGKRDYYPGTDDLYFWGIYSQPWTNITYGNYYDRWTEDNPNGYFPRFKSYVAECVDKECGVVQTRYLQNAAYIRLKNLTIGYTLPKPLTLNSAIIPRNI